MWPINSSWLLKLLRQIMQVSNLSHDVNSNVLLNFVICFKGLLAVRAAQLQHLRFWVCSWTNFHVLNNLLLVDEVGMAEWARIVRSFRRSLHLLSCFLLQGWLKPRKDQLCWSFWFSARDRCWCSGRGCKGHSWVSTSWANPKIPQFCWCVA